MTAFFQTLFHRYPIKTRRALELLPGMFSWILILSPFVGSLFIPQVIAYFILFFDVYWFYRSFSLAATAYTASKKIKQAEQIDWRKKTLSFKDVAKVTHIVVIPNYREGITKLRSCLASLAVQTFPTKQLFVVLAMEKREEEGKEKIATLRREFGSTFEHLLATYHPDIEDEMKGKSSNQAYAAGVVSRDFIEKGLIDEQFATISSVDADSIFDKQYFSYLTSMFLSDSKRFNKFWQSANVNYNNFWRVPAPIRVISFFGSLWRTGVLVQKDRLITNSTYSLSFQLLRRIGFWDTDVIPEDYRIFFKAFYKLSGQVWVEPIFLKTSMDAPLSTDYLRSIRNKYNQERRWSWGVSDDPLFMRWWLTVPNVPFLRKTLILSNVLIDHFLWPANWFIITIAANILPLVNPAFSRTALGYNLPRLAGFILTSCLLALLSMIVVDFRNSNKNTSLPLLRRFLFPLEFVLLPIVGFFLSTLPALISHTQLMFGKRLEYKVTEKV